MVGAVASGGAEGEDNSDIDLPTSDHSRSAADPVAIGGLINGQQFRTIESDR